MVYLFVNFDIWNKIYHRMIVYMVYTSTFSAHTINYKYFASSNVSTNFFENVSGLKRTKIAPIIEIPPNRMVGSA